MVIFQHNLIFVDEPQLEDEVVDDVLNTIFVVEKSPFCLQDRYIEYSEWTVISGQNVRYHSTLPLRESISRFSWALEIEDVALLCWERDEQKIYYIKGRHYTPERLQFWILHTFFPMILELERIYTILHVGAVEIESRAILFSAPSFGGKSTLTEYFLDRGHAMLSDDSLAIERRGNTYYAIPSYPFCRPYRELGSLGIYRENFVDKPKVISAIFKLQRSKPDDEIAIYEMRGIDKFETLYSSRFIDFSSAKVDSYHYYTKMANSVNIYRIDIPWDKKRLSEIHDKIISSLQAQ